jgi:hypothetical protein
VIIHRKMQKKWHHEAVASSQIWSQTRYEVQIFNHFFIQTQSQVSKSGLKKNLTYGDWNFSKSLHFRFSNFKFSFKFGSKKKGWARVNQRPPAHHSLDAHYDSVVVFLFGLVCLFLVPLQVWMNGVYVV